MKKTPPEEFWKEGKNQIKKDKLSSRYTNTLAAIFWQCASPCFRIPSILLSHSFIKNHLIVIHNFPREVDLEKR